MSNLHPLIEYILHAKSKPSLHTIKDACVLDKNGEIDVKWYNSLSNEQQIRMDIAAFIQYLIDKKVITYSLQNGTRQIIPYHKK